MSRSRLLSLGVLVALVAMTAQPQAQQVPNPTAAAQVPGPAPGPCDGSLTLYAGAKSPGADKESNWLPAPSGPFSLYIRAYWADQAIIDGSWTPPAVRQVN